MYMYASDRSLHEIHAQQYRPCRRSHAFKRPASRPLRHPQTSARSSEASVVKLWRRSSSALSRQRRGDGSAIRTSWREIRGASCGPSRLPQPNRRPASDVQPYNPSALVPLYEAAKDGVLLDASGLRRPALLLFYAALPPAPSATANPPYSYIWSVSLRYAND